MTLLMHNLSNDDIRPWVKLIQLPLQGGTDETTRRVSLLLESVELLLQLDRKLNNDANKLGHDRNPPWVEWSFGMKLLHMLCLASIWLTV